MLEIFITPWHGKKPKRTLFKKERENRNLECCKNVKNPDILRKKMLDIFGLKNREFFVGVFFHFSRDFFFSSQTPLKGFLERGPKIFCSSQRNNSCHFSGEEKFTRGFVLF